MILFKVEVIIASPFESNSLTIRLFLFSEKLANTSNNGGIFG